MAVKRDLERATAIDRRWSKQPGFTNGFKPVTREWSAEELAELARDGIFPKPKAEREAKQKQAAKSDGIDFDAYIPRNRRIAFKRMEAAGFEHEKAENLKSLTYSQLIELRWHKIAEQAAINDWRERHKNDG